MLWNWRLKMPKRLPSEKQLKRWWGEPVFFLGFRCVDGTIDQKTLSFADFAVLFRTRSQGHVIISYFGKSGNSLPGNRSQNRFGSPRGKSSLSVFKTAARHGGVYRSSSHCRVVSNLRFPKKTLELFKVWAYQKKLSLSEALLQTRRFPIPRMGRARVSSSYIFYRTIIRVKENHRWPVDRDTLELYHE
jgi:hypothetical protein